MAVSANDKIVRGGDLATIGAQIKTKLAEKQDTLVSGTNLKTINNTSLLGSGDITITDGQDGASAYEIWVAAGNTGTVADFLASLKGDSGYSGAAGELEVVNNLTKGGAESALSAEMGKTLNNTLISFSGGDKRYEVSDFENSGFESVHSGYQLLANSSSMGKTIANVSKTAGANYRNYVIPLDEIVAIEYYSYTSTSGYGSLFLNSDNVVVGYHTKTSSESNPITPTIPSTAAYFVYSFSNTSTDAYCKLTYKGEVPAIREDILDVQNKNEANTEEITNLNGCKKYSREELLAMSGTYSMYQFKANDDELGKTLSTATKASDDYIQNVMIDVSGYVYLNALQYGSSYNYGSLFLDEDGVIIGGLRLTSSGDTFAYIPSNAKYLLYSFYITNSNVHLELYKVPELGAAVESNSTSISKTVIGEQKSYSRENMDFKYFPYRRKGRYYLRETSIGTNLDDIPFTPTNGYFTFLIPVDGWSTVTFYTINGVNGYGSAFLDENRNLLSYYLSPSGQTVTQTIPSNTKYFLFLSAWNSDVITFTSDNSLSSEVATIKSRIDEISSGAGAGQKTGLTPKVYFGYITQAGTLVEDNTYVTTETIFGDFHFNLADGFKIYSASLYDRDGNIVSYNHIHPDVYHSGIRAARSFLSNGNTVPQYGMRVVIRKDDAGVISSEDTIFTEFVKLEDSGLHRWIPEDLPNYDIALRRINYFQHLRWVPLLKVHDGYGTSVVNNYFCLPGQVQVGVPYSDVAETRKYVPNNVSIRTFLTAAKNKRSLLYTEDLQTNTSKYGMSYQSGNRRAYYGEVCSGFTAWVMGVDTLYLSNQYGLDGVPGMTAISNITADNVRPLDFVWSNGHITIISDVYKDEFGKVKYVVIAEMSTPYPYRTLYTPEQFSTRIAANNATGHRWNGWSSLTEPEDMSKYSQYTLGGLPYNYPVNEDIMTFAGDYAAFADGEKIVLNARRNSVYTGVELYKDDALLQTIDISSMAADGIYSDSEDWVAVDLSSYNLGAGKYKACLTDGTNTTDFTYFEIVGLTVSASVVSGGLSVSFSSTGGSVVSIEQCQVSGFAYKYHPVTETERTNGVVNLSGWAYNSNYPKIIILARGDYGVVHKMIDVPQ